VPHQSRFLPSRHLHVELQRSEGETLGGKRQEELQMSVETSERMVKRENSGRRLNAMQIQTPSGFTSTGLTHTHRTPCRICRGCSDISFAAVGKNSSSFYLTAEVIQTFP